MARSSRYFPNHSLDEKVICNNAEPWKAVALITIWQESLVLCMIPAQYFSGAQPVAVINDAELARWALFPLALMCWANNSSGREESDFYRLAGVLSAACIWLPFLSRLVSLRLSTRHEFRGPASLFTGAEKEFDKSGLFSTNE